MNAEEVPEIGTNEKRKVRVMNKLPSLVRRTARSVLAGFVNVLVAELDARARALAESVERTGTTSDLADANMLRLIASSIDRAHAIYAKLEP